MRLIVQSLTSFLVVCKVVRLSFLLFPSSPRGGRPVRRTNDRWSGNSTRLLLRRTFTCHVRLISRRVESPSPFFTPKPLSGSGVNKRFIPSEVAWAVAFLPVTKAIRYSMSWQCWIFQPRPYPEFSLQSVCHKDPHAKKCLISHDWKCWDLAVFTLVVCKSY